ncbi:putative pyranose oxidase [Pisolithus marmoratus]|nr:putative pyranose oxidase [Pisolithus marmoratus]
MADPIDPPLHPVHEKPEFRGKDVHVFIAGSGPIGATFARLLVDAGFNVVMADIGDQGTRVPGSHKKNEVEYQKDIDRFVRVIQGALSPVSVPVSRTYMDNLDPSAYQNPSDLITIGRNPNQKDHENLAAEAVTRCIGGMATHWTCATPRFTGDELPRIYEDETHNEEHWGCLYSIAERLIGTSTHEFDHSIRHNLVLNTLRQEYPNRGVQPIPLACHRYADGSPYVYWHSVSEIFGDMFDEPNKVNGEGVQRGAFALLRNTRCSQLRKKEGSVPYEIKDVVVEDLLKDKSLPEPLPEIRRFYSIKAKVFVIAAGAVGTPQILANSGFGGFPEQVNPIIPNLGLRITEQPMAFCQVILRKTLIDSIRDPNNPGKFPIPPYDPEPQVTIPVDTSLDENRKAKQPWHTQIHRDAFNYGEVGPQADPRVVVDLRFFGRQGPDVQNKLTFEKLYKDTYDMPQPTFVYRPTEPYITEAHDMMNDMTNVAHKLGGYLPGSYPQFMTPGLALHLGGTTRLGRESEKNTTVGDYNSKVWDFTNLYVGGNGNIPTPFGANPTLTSMCFALRAVLRIKRDLSTRQDTPTETEVDITVEDFSFAFNAADPNHPDFRYHTMPPAANDL